jgi:hypothetical protein
MAPSRWGLSLRGEGSFVKCAVVGCHITINRLTRVCPKADGHDRLLVAELCPLSLPPFDRLMPVRIAAQIVDDLGHSQSSRAHAQTPRLFRYHSKSMQL